MSAPPAKRTNFRHVVESDSPVGQVYQWAMAERYRRDKLAQSLTAFWLPSAYEELKPDLLPEAVRQIALESIHLLEAQARILRDRYGFSQNMVAAPLAIAAPGSAAAAPVGDRIVTKPDQAPAQQPDDDIPIEIDYTEFLFENELPGDT